MVTDAIIDAIMLVDITLHFFYAYVNKRQKVIKDFRSIFLRYIFRSFVFDVVSIFPYYIIPVLRTYHFLRLSRFVRTSGVLGWVSVVLNSTLIRMTSNINFAISLTRIIVFSFLLLFTAHFISCLWFYIGYQNL